MGNRMNEAETRQFNELRDAVTALAEQLGASDAARHEMSERADRDLGRAVDLNRELRRARDQTAAAEEKVKSLTSMCESLRDDLIEAQDRAIRAEEVHAELAAAVRTVEEKEAVIVALKRDLRRATRRTPANRAPAAPSA